jgi:hypothetical protein
MKFLLGVVVGLLLALVLNSTAPAEAQVVRRMFGTLSSGAQRAIQVNSSGQIEVTLQ